MAENIEMDCGCWFRPLCCICNGTSDECFPFHFARSRWRVYPGPGYAGQGAHCTVRVHRKFFARGGARFDCPKRGYRQLVLMIRPSAEERKMLYSLARRMKPKQKKLLREAIREGQTVPQLFSYGQDDPEYENYLDGIGNADMDEGDVRGLRAGW